MELARRQMTASRPHTPTQKLRQSAESREGRDCGAYACKSETEPNHDAHQNANTTRPRTSSRAVIMPSNALMFLQAVTGTLSRGRFPVGVRRQCRVQWGMEWNTDRSRWQADRESDSKTS